MGVPTPFHDKTAPLCRSMRWKEWAGYFCPEKYDTVHDSEYVLFRQACGLLDISPLYKYDVRGRGALAFMNRVMARDVARLKHRQVAYATWCDEDGKVLDDGTISMLDEGHYRITSANPSMRWFSMNAFGLDVRIEDRSQAVAALALQGPTSRRVLQQVTDAPVDALKFFWLTPARIAGVDTIISRTGYTGDLGYEIWMAAEDAHCVWDAIMDGGCDYGIGPAGLLALDMARIEAGFILIDVDYVSARHALIEAQKSSPFEIGLGWTVHAERDGWFVGQEALLREKAQGSKWALVGLEIDWDEMESLYDALGLPPHLPTTAWRTPVPVYGSGGRQVGRATSGTWSPLLKKNLALATVESRYGEAGTKLRIEMTVEYERKLVTATVVPRPFFDPPRKKSVEARMKAAVGA